MKIRVTAPPFCSHDAVDDAGFVEVHDHAAVSDVVKLLKVPLAARPLLFYYVNYEKAGLRRRLADGDVLSVFWPLSGG